MVSLEHYQSLLPATYTVQSKLGEGGFSQTLLAQRAPDQTLCVLKVLSLKRSNDWKAIELFEREVKLLRHLKHPGIPEFYDSFNVTEGQETWFFLVQAYLPGKSLQEWLESGKRFSEAQVINLALKLSEILFYLQNFSPPIIHRDIKPSNIMLDQGKVWLIDFGAVKDSLQQSQGRGSTIVGTFGYMPLEQYEGRAQPASDIYGLGMSLLYALSGIEPLHMKKRGLKTDFRQHIQVSAGFGRILERMIEPDMDARYPTAQSLQTDLKPLLTTAKRSSPVLGTRSRTPQKHWRGILIIAFLTISSGLVAVWLKSSDQLIEQPREALSSLTDSAPQLPDPWSKANLALPLGIQAIHSQGETLWLSSSSEVFHLSPGQLRQWDAESLLGGPSYYGFQLAVTSEGVAYALGKTSTGQAGLNQITQTQVTNIPLPGTGDYNALAIYEQSLLLANGSKLWQYAFSTQTWQLLDSLPARYSRLPAIRALAVQGQQVWVAADSGLWQLQNGKLISRWQGQSFISHLAAGPDGRIWLGGREGLSVWTPATGQAQQLLAQEDVLALTVDSDNAIWVGTRESGLLHWLSQAQRWQTLGWREGLPDDHVRALALQGERLWLALDSQVPHWANLSDLKALLSQGFLLPEISAQRYADACTASSQTGTGGQVQQVMYQDKAHVFFNGQQVCPPGSGAINAKGVAALAHPTHGIVRGQTGQYEVLGYPPGVKKYSSVRSILIDSSQRVWLSLYGEGVFMHAGTWQRVNTPDDFQPTFGASDDTVFLGRTNSSGPQLMRYHHQTLQPLSLSDRMTTVQQVLGLPGGGAAVATTQGLFLLDAQHKTRHFNYQNSLPSDYIWSMTHTPEAFWLSVGKGISRLALPQGSTIQFTSRDGLFSDRIRALAVDHQNRLWLQNQHREVALYRLEDLR